MKVKVEDKDWLKARLGKRLKEFQTSLLENDMEKAWDIRSGSFKKIFNKNDYIGYLKDEQIGEHYKVKYSVENIDIREKRAKVKIRSILQKQKIGCVCEFDLYEYWEFEEGDWFLDERGSTAIRADWW
jgi:hypothetical protein